MMLREARFPSNEMRDVRIGWKADVSLCAACTAGVDLKPVVTCAFAPRGERHAKDVHASDFIGGVAVWLQQRIG